MAFATVADVGVSLGRPISDGSWSTADIAQVQSWLDRVETRIRRRIPGINLLALNADYSASLLGVETDVVVRRVLNPEGKTSEKIDDYAYGLTATAASSDLWPTDAEWVELRPRRSTGAFSISPKLSA